jgi:hypothetical protein
VGVVPDTQTFPLQHPLQLLGEQLVVPSHTPPLPSATQVVPFAVQFEHT